MIFSGTYYPQIEDYSRSGKLSAEAVLRIFLNAGSYHSDSVSDSVIQGSLDGVAWILTEWRVSLFSRPPYSKQLEYSTWARAKTKQSRVSRDFTLDMDGERIAQGSARFVLLDLETSKPFGISEELMTAYAPEEKSVYDDKLPKLREPESYEKTMPIAMRRSDMDFNGHVHNICYLGYALEMIPEEDYLSENFSQIRIVYKSPLHEGEKAEAGCCCIDGRNTVGIYGNGELKAIVELS